MILIRTIELLSPEIKEVKNIIERRKLKKKERKENL